MTVVLAGSSGLVGRALEKALVERGDRVIRLVRERRTAQPGDAFWEPTEGRISNPGVLEGADAIVNLAGASIADRKWTRKRKAEIRDSRVPATEALAKLAAQMSPKPRVMLVASAVGFYGDRGDEPLTEESPRGTGFLADTCVEWEAASDAAATAGIRTVKLRFGVILSRHGGLLKTLLPLFQKGMGGRIGSGKQYVAWIELSDAVRAILFALDHESLSGPVNCCTPTPVRNADFASALGEALCRPTLLPVPGFVLRTTYGELADELMLAGAKMLPTKLEAAGFKFEYGELPSALKRALG